MRLVVDPERAFGSKRFQRGADLHRIVAKVVKDIDPVDRADRFEPPAHAAERRHRGRGALQRDARRDGRGDGEERVLDGHRAREGNRDLDSVDLELDRIRAQADRARDEVGRRPRRDSLDRGVEAGEPIRTAHFGQDRIAAVDDGPLAGLLEERLERTGGLVDLFVVAAQVREDRDRRGELGDAPVAFIGLDHEPIALAEAETSRWHRPLQPNRGSASEERRVESRLEEQVRGHGGDGRLAAGPRDGDRATGAGDPGEKRAAADAPDTQLGRAAEVRIGALHRCGVDERGEVRRDRAPVLGHEADPAVAEGDERRKREAAVQVPVRPGHLGTQGDGEDRERRHAAPADAAEVVTAVPKRERSEVWLHDRTSLLGRRVLVKCGARTPPPGAYRRGAEDS